MGDMKRKKGHKDKHGNNKKDCEEYKTRRQRIKNARRRVAKWTQHLKPETRDRIRAEQPKGRTSDI